MQHSKREFSISFEVLNLQQDRKDRMNANAEISFSCKKYHYFLYDWKIQSCTLSKAIIIIRSVAFLYVHTTASVKNSAWTLMVQVVVCSTHNCRVPGSSPGPAVPPSLAISRLVVFMEGVNSEPLPVINTCCCPNVKQCPD